MAGAGAEARPLPRPPVVPFATSAARRWRLIVVLGLLIVAHVVGWQVTKIDIPELIFGLPRMRHIVVGLLQPDAFVRLRDEVMLSGKVMFSASGQPPVAGGSASTITATAGTARLVIEPAQVSSGQVVNVQGSGWPAGKQGEVVLIDAGGQPKSAGTFTVAPDGTINYAFYAPAWAQGPYELRARVDTPRFGWRPTETLILCLRLMVETLFLALMGTSMAVVLTIPLSFLGARNLMSRTPAGRFIYMFTRALFNLLRSIEVVIVVTIMAVVVGIGSFAGVLAIVVHSIGALGKLYSEAIEDIDPGPIEAISATGARSLQIIRYGVIPQVVPQFLSFTLYRLDINVRMSTIVGLVGGGGIGFILTQYINLLQWNQAGTAIWLIALVVTAIDYLSAWLREKTI